MTLVDAVLWALAAVLLGAALLILAREERPWDPAVFFAGALAALRRRAGESPVALRAGPIPDDGWDGDVDALEEAVSPAMRLDPALGWEDLGGDAALAAIRRRGAAVRLVWFDPPAVSVDGFDAVVLTPGADPLLDPLADLLEAADTRLVLVAGAHAEVLLRALADAPGVRDRLRAVLLVGADLDPAWLASSFTHAAFDVEVQREVPYLTLRAGGVPPLPDPPDPPTGRRSIAVVDLGIPTDEALAHPSMGRALGALLAAVG
jgi:hypothetical protein